MDTKRFEGHTPGPWRRTNLTIHNATPNGSFSIAVCLDSHETNAITRGPEEATANAALIAAAPDLLADNERLRGVLGKWERFMLDNYKREDISWWNETRAAVAETENGQREG